MRPGLRILLHLYEFEDVATRLSMHIVAAEEDAKRFWDGEATGLISLRKQDAVILRKYEAELVA